MELYLVGEDPVTKSIAQKLVSHCLDIVPSSITELPARGSKILTEIAKYNNLAENAYVIVVSDLDDKHCPITVINDILPKVNHKPKFAFNIAVTEAEAWLMSDREGFANFLGISLQHIPEPYKLSPIRRPHDIELKFDMKPSLYLMFELAPKSSKAAIREGLKPIDRTSKGPDYNLTLLPFIEHHWNINAAALNSYSLTTSIERVCKTLKIA